MATLAEILKKVRPVVKQVAEATKPTVISDEERARILKESQGGLAGILSRGATVGEQVVEATKPNIPTDVERQEVLGAAGEDLRQGFFGRAGAAVRDVTNIGVEKTSKGLIGLFGGLAPSFKQIGKSIAGIQTGREQEDITRNQVVLADNLLREIRNPNLTDARKLTLKKLFDDINPDIISNNPELKQTAREVFGAAITTGTTAAGISGLFKGAAVLAVKKAGVGAGIKAGIPQALAKTAINVGLKGTVQGGLFGLGSGLQKGKVGKELTAPVVLGALTGTAVSLAGEMLRAAKDMLKHRPANVMQRAFNVPKKFLRKDVFNNRKTLTARMVEQGYKGTPSSHNSNSIASRST